MAADLFETYAVTVVATMVLAAIFFAGQPPRRHDALSAGHLRRLHRHLDHRHLLRQARRQANNIMGALYKGLIVTGVLSLVGSAGDLSSPSADLNATIVGTPAAHLHGPMTCSGAASSASSSPAADRRITEYYTGTGYRPVRSIARPR
jgi:K(+)-stimulated pyrophosphate-energized sodium pump